MCCTVRIVGERGIAHRRVGSCAGKLSEEVANVLETAEVQGGFILCEECHEGCVPHSTVFFCTNSKFLTLICNDKHKIDILRTLVPNPL